jgi:hypothetical protein
VQRPKGRLDNCSVPCAYMRLFSVTVAFRGPTAPMKWVGELCQVIKRPEREADHSRLSRTSWRLIRHKDNCTFRVRIKLAHCRVDVNAITQLFVILNREFLVTSLVLLHMALTASVVRMRVIGTVLSLYGLSYVRPTVREQGASARSGGSRIYEQDCDCRTPFSTTALTKSQRNRV